MWSATQDLLLMLAIKIVGTDFFFLKRERKVSGISILRRTSNKDNSHQMPRADKAKAANLNTVLRGIVGTGIERTTQENVGWKR